MKIINTAVIGFGFGGRIFHAPFLAVHPAYSISRILTTDPVKRATAQLAYPQAKLITDYEEALSDPNIDLIVLAIPNHLHFSYATKALEAGKHVVVEKPFTVTSAEAYELIANAKKQDRLVTVYQNRRLDSDFRTVQRILDQGLLGRVVEYEARYDRFRNYIKDSWKQTKVPGGGILYDLGAHLIDQALTLFGFPKEIYADLRMQRDQAVVTDNFELILTYPQLKVTLKAGMLVRERGPRFSVFGTRGTFLKYGMDTQEADLLNGKRPGNDHAWGREPKENWGLINTEVSGITISGKVESERGDYLQFYDNLHQAICGKTDLLIHPDTARQVIQVIERAYQSHSEGRRIPLA